MITEGLTFGEIEVWDVRKRLRTGTLRGHLDTVNSVVFGASDRLLSSSQDATIKIWNPLLPQEMRVIGRPIAFDINPAILANGGSLMAYSESGAVSLVTGPVTSITIVDLTADAKQAPADGGMLQAVGRAIFNPKTNEPTRILQGNFDGTVLLSASADGRWLLSAGRHGDVSMWDLKTDQEVLPPEKKDAQAAAPTADPNLPATPQVGSEKTDASSPPPPSSADVISTPERTHNMQSGAITALALSPDGRWAASAREPAEIAQARLGRTPWPAQPVPALISIWDSTTRKERFSLPGHTNKVDQLVFSPDGRWLASAGGRMIRIWNAVTGQLVHELDRGDLRYTVSELVFSPTSALLAAAGDQAVQVWEVSSGKPVGLFRGHRGQVMVAFSPDETRLATAAGREVKLWDVKTGQEALSLPLMPLSSDDRAPFVAVLAFRPDGQHLRAALRDGSVVEWDATPVEPAPSER